MKKIRKKARTIKSKRSPLHSLLSKEETLVIAKKILGCRLTTCIDGVITSGRIIEVEAYDGRVDEACHAFHGETNRTKVMFGPAGYAYIYFIYGMHFCFNIVTEKEGIGSAVLVRALEPIDGIDVMKKRRRTDAIKSLCSGPGKLCEALGITKELNGENLLSSPRLFLENDNTDPPLDENIVRATRIGIAKSKDFPWRFYLRNKINFVSKK